MSDALKDASNNNNLVSMIFLTSGTGIFIYIFIKTITFLLEGVINM